MYGRYSHIMKNPMDKKSRLSTLRCLSIQSKESLYSNQTAVYNVYFLGNHLSYDYEVENFVRKNEYLGRTF